MKVRFACSALVLTLMMVMLACGEDVNDEVGDEVEIDDGEDIGTVDQGGSPGQFHGLAGNDTWTIEYTEHGGTSCYELVLDGVESNHCLPRPQLTSSGGDHVALSSYYSSSAGDVALVTGTVPLGTTQFEFPDSEGVIGPVLDQRLGVFVMLINPSAGERRFEFAVSGTGALECYTVGSLWRLSYGCDPA